MEEDLPAAEGVTKDSNDGSTPMKGEVLPSGSSPEVDIERITADEAKLFGGEKERSRSTKKISLWDSWSRTSSVTQR